MSLTNYPVLVITQLIDPSSTDGECKYRQICTNIILCETEALAKQLIQGCDTGGLDSEDILIEMRPLW